MRYPDVMIDIETLATTPRAHVLSVGAVGFNKDTYELAQGFHVALAFGQQREISADTVAWWMRQSKAAQAAAFMGQCPVEQALADLATYIDQQARKCRVWANGPQFDLVILRDIYRQYGMPCPWHYRQERDFRTAMDGCDATLAVPSVGEAHNALDDAIWQAKAIQFRNRRV